MGFSDAIRTCFRKYLVFSGRATRPEYWWFALFIILTSAILAFVDNLLFGSNPETSEGTRVLSSVFQLGVVIPMLAAGWRRLHDTGRPGWYLLLPLALSIVTMVMLLTGVVAFSVLEQGVDDPEALRGPAALLGGTGIMVASILQLILSALMIWWLTRPSESGTNEYGPPA
ncbi:DUF805 domain-containing protein [Falsiruegeria mediterranea]|uniref:DUF805 domain-containing protein n=1 Tax=Falsiruegeria mediterranea TaxID=1280832 RepID=UPI0015F25C74|nr:DUF805 domain-containing protein [Falsiruegeria mediterranea]